MSLEEAVETLRLVNVVLAAIALVTYAIRINNVWEHRTKGQRTIRVGFIALLLSVAYGSAESWAQQAPVGFRSVLLTIACLIVLLGLWRVRNQHDHRDHWS